MKNDSVAMDAPLSLSDAVEVVCVLRSCYEVFLNDFAPTALKWTAEEILQHAKDWILLKVRGVPVGTVRHSIDGESYTFDCLGVIPAARGNGFGKLLIQEVEKSALRTGRRHLVIAVRSSLTFNKDYFHNLGFRKGGRFTNDHDIWSKTLYR